jgi:hypothetical protein
MRVTRVWMALAMAGCVPVADETDTAATGVEEPAWPEVWEYATFCWFADTDECKLNDGTNVGDERVNCVGEEDTYECVTDALNDLGAEGWRLDLPDRSFPDNAVVYLMYRAG